MALRVLVAGRDRPGLEQLEPDLAAAGYEVFCAASADEAADLARRALPDVILWGLLDQAGPGAMARGPGSPYLVALVGVDAGEQPGTGGLLDALSLPCSQASLDLLMRRASAWCRLQRDLRLARREVSQGGGDRPIVAASPAMIGLLEALERAGSFSASVLIRGERGTGKEGLARAIHAQSSRRGGSFVAFDCRRDAGGATHRALFGGGGTPGAFVEADGGTLFLDDVDALPPDCQEGLLQALETEEIAPDGTDKTRRVDVRVIASCAADPHHGVPAGGFRADLLERLAGLELEVPPLRARSQDIPLLVDHFAARASHALGRSRPVLTDDAFERLLAYHWPGNVRELENVIERSVLLSRGERITARQLPPLPDIADRVEERDLGLRRARRRLEQQLIRSALRRTGGNRTHAARLLEISHRALLYKLKEHGIKD